MDFLVNWVSNIPGFAVPFALAALGLILTEKSGVLSLGAEGFMLMGAMAGVGAVIVTGEPLLALVIAALATAVISLVFAALVVALRVNQVIAGLAMVFLCQGLTSLIASLRRLEQRRHRRPAQACRSPASPTSPSPAASCSSRTSSSI